MEYYIDELLIIWDKILLSIQKDFSIPEVSFKTFVQPLEPYAIEGNKLVVIFQDENDERGLNYINKKYGKSLKVKIAEMTDKEYEITFILANEAPDFTFPDTTKRKSLTQNTLVNYKNTNLNSKYTFDTFVVGANSRFAYNASLAVADSPGEAYNPLYIYGGPGLGKTHLMHSIGNFIINEHPERKVLYVTSEDFVNEVINSIRDANNIDSMSRLREKYRSVDVLMVDDIQFIIGKESTQTEFFHTFNALHAAGKQIIISSDRPPKEMETLEERIKSRFEMGLLTDIGIPDYETRMAILRKKIEKEDILLTDDILDYIAENIKSNIREMEGALNKLIAFYTLDKKEITLEIAKNELSSYIYPGKQKEITPQVIIEVVADHYNISIDQMCSTRRTREISEPRQIAMFLCKEMTEYPFQAIGTLLGGKDHSTVIHGVNKVGDRYNDDNEFKNEIDAIKNKIIS